MSFQRLDGVDPGRYGVFAGPLNAQPSAVQRDFARRMEGLGYGTLWVGEGLAQEIFGRCGMLLAATERLTIASGIANIWARDASAMANGGRTLAEAFPHRFILGLGVSHAPMVKARGHDYEKPYTAMTKYLDSLREARYAGPAADMPPIVLAALGPRMATLAGEKTAGAYPYFTTDEHVREVRGHIGPDAFLVADLPVVFAEDLAGARAVGGRHLEYYLGAANYRNNLLRLGWTEADLEAPGSDALFDAIVAWGSPDQIRARVERRFGAGADHIAFNLVGGSRVDLTLDVLEALARALDLPAR